MGTRDRHPADPASPKFSLHLKRLRLRPTRHVAAHTKFDTFASSLATQAELGDASEAALQAWSQAGGVAEDVVDAGRRATRSVARQIGEKPLIAVLVGFALGYVAGLWMKGGRRPGRTADDR